MPDDDFGSLSDLWDECHPVGSAVTCDPPVLDTDRDYLVLATKWKVFLLMAVGDDGWDLSEYWETHDISRALEEGDFVSLRKGNVNIILTASKMFAKRFLAATAVAKHLNLLKKSDRIKLFQAVLYGN